MAGALTAMVASIFSGGVTADPHYEYTTLLLPGNGTNGAQNNTFLDASTNNFTITRNGNTTQGTFSPFSQTGWGNYFDGTGDGLTLANSEKFDFGSGDFTIELWVYFVTHSHTHHLVSKRTSSGATNTNWFLEVASGVCTFRASDGSTFFISSLGNGVVSSIGVWYHIAVTRSGNDFKMFINGTQAGSTVSSSSSISNTSRDLNIGLDPSFANNRLNGYISNLRIVKGRAVYTSDFSSSVPTSPLTSTTGGTNPPQGTECSLLTCQSNRFLDSNGVNTPATSPLTITVNGNTSVQAFSPFNPTASWSAATYGGSGYFDGTGDYLSVADNSNLRLGTNAFTIQGWVYRNASGAAHSIIAKGGASTGFVLQVTSTNILRFTHGTTNVDTTTTIPASAWTHIAAVRTNTSTNGFQLYINGVSSATATVSTDFNQTDTLYAGADRSAANVMNGFISGLKYTNGTAESIAVPTEPPTATTNVALLLNFTNAGIYDATSKNDLETVGNAQISTAQSKWGGSSMAFDGTGDWLFSRGSLADLTNFGAGDFTIEAWVRFSDLSGTRALCGKWGGASNRGWFFYYEANNIYFGYSTTGSNATDALGSWTPSINTWYYVAVTRSGANLRLYVDGSQKGTTHNISTSSIYASTSVFSVAQRGDDFGALNGYLQDLRITKGVARNVTVVPTAAFPTL